MATACLYPTGNSPLRSVWPLSPLQGQAPSTCHHPVGARGRSLVVGAEQHSDYRVPAFNWVSGRQAGETPRWWVGCPTLPGAPQTPSEGTIPEPRATSTTWWMISEWMSRSHIAGHHSVPCTGDLSLGLWNPKGEIQLLLVLCVQYPQWAPLGNLTNKGVTEWMRWWVNDLKLLGPSFWVPRNGWRAPSALSIFSSSSSTFSSSARFFATQFLCWRKGGTGLPWDRRQPL